MQFCLPRINKKLLQERFTILDTTYASVSSKTTYPAQVVLGGAYRVSPSFSVDVAVRQYLDNDYFTGVDPKFSVGLEIESTPILPIYLGVGIGGFHGFSWGGGFSLNIDLRRFDCETGGDVPAHFFSVRADSRRFADDRQINIFNFR